MHLMVDARGAQKRTKTRPSIPAQYAARCGKIFYAKTDAISVWGSEITCVVCHG